ncbi:hypothetical protein PC118_g15143 [Phytophthora cactorum]|uniref:Crinkler effector protein N-terminal domain-containing protein n=1 Tax=Phytophthora cactorum TaxID=29920 RepID=A0A8T1FEL1_9STRA|nr:hypothetical protein PC118_g15143 [Phytophthora cactorum]
MKAIKAEKPNKIQGDAKDLQLFLAKKDGGAGAWLTEKDVKEGVSDRDTSDLELLDVAGAPLNLVGLSEEDVRFQVTKEVVKAGKVPVHVLVVVPTGIDITIGGDGNADSVLELKHYQKRGVQIQSNCKEYCERILDKIDSLYQPDGVLPFICVEGSLGMGKSQLAFALGGRRRWFYWPATSVGVDSQRLYSNFTSIADRFDEVTKKDKVSEKYIVNILNCASTVYSHDKLWIYGFILALLKYYDKLEDDRDAGMIRFEKNVSLHVDMCDRDTVAAFKKKLKDEDKAVPFFMMDKLTANTHHDDQGKKIAAFQRNVFRACGLVLVVMGTDAKIGNLIHQNGVRGILFEAFFPWLLGEFQEQVTHPTKLMMDEEEMAFSGLLDGYNELAQLPGKNVPFLAPPNAEWPPYILGADWGCFGHLDRLKNEERGDISVREVSSDTPLFFCECKYWHKKVDSRAMKGIMKGLETVQEDKWKIVFVFCVGLTNFRKGSWAHGSIGCVRIDCRSGDVKWVVQPDEGHRKKLVVVMETGPVKIETHMSGRNSAA